MPLLPIIFPSLVLVIKSIIYLEMVYGNVICMLYIGYNLLYFIILLPKLNNLLLEVSLAVWSIFA